MPFGYDDESNVAVQERETEDERDDVVAGRRSSRLERKICENCRMLLSVIETRLGKCRTCHTEMGSAKN